MSATAILAAAEAEGHHVLVELPIPAWGYGVIALVAFFALGLVTFSFRHVAERHAAKLDGADAGSHGH